MRVFLKNLKGFTLIEAILIIVVVSGALFGLGYLFGNLDQEALTADLTVLATKLAREKMEEVIQEKADGGYAAISSEIAETVTSGSWDFTRSVDVSYVNQTDFSNSVADTGYRKVVVNVSWGVNSGENVSLTTLVTNVTP